LQWLKGVKDRSLEILNLSSSVRSGLCAMASSDEAPDAAGGPRLSNAGAPGADGGAAPPRRARSKEAHNEVIDELAQETKRVTLLDREEQQLKGRKHISRLLFIFGIVDDRKMQSAVEQEFTSWRDRQDGGSEVTGLLLFLGQAAVSFLEGPTELVFKAMELFHGLSQDVQPATVMPLAPADMRTNLPAARTETEAPASAPRAALISAIRILYCTELHGVRTSVGWCSFVSPAKLQTGGAQNSDLDSHELVFALYKKLLVTCLKVRDNAGNETHPANLQSYYRKQSDHLPLPDEVVLLLGKQGAENFFNFAEFQKVFMKPFQLVLNSELLWPMPPALSY
jgi:hypothetical protein